MKNLLSLALLLITVKAFALGACVTNATLGILYADGNNIAFMKETPYSWCPNICDDPGYAWHGTCMISSMNSCTNTEWDGVPLQVHVNGITNLPVVIGLISVSCSNGGHENALIWMPANCGDCTFRFFATCSGTNCSVSICPTCTTFAVPAPPEQ